MRKICNVLSFRQSLLLPITLMILSAQESGHARAVARALNGALEASRNPEQTLDAFGNGLGKRNSRATIC